MTRKFSHIKIPTEGENPESILQQIKLLKQEDVDWTHGKVWSMVYHVNKEHDNLLKSAHSEMFSANYLNPLAFKSLHKMEQEVVHMTAKMLNGDEHSVGVMTTGGTESIILAMLGYIQRARKLHPQITSPEVVAPRTIHPAFDKAALFLGFQLRKAPVDESRCVILSELEELINDNTVLITVSAPSYPNGVMDPVEAVSEIAIRHNLPFHVDACIGGFMLPWIEKLGFVVPRWDYRVLGVTSISADVHKFGYGAKGASTLTYRSMEYLHHQFVVTTDFPGGIYISPTLLGTRAGGPIAAAWAGIKHMGEKGYLSLAKKLMEGAQKLRKELPAITGISIVGNPIMNIISYTTIDNDPDIFVIADQLEEKGWLVDRQQFPDCIHLTILPINVDKIDQYLADLKAAVTYANKHHEATAKGNASFYGLMARIPFRGMVEESVKKVMEDMYGEEEINETDESENKNDSIVQLPAWMRILNRFLSAWTRWRESFRSRK